MFYILEVEPQLCTRFFPDLSVSKESYFSLELIESLLIAWYAGLARLHTFMGDRGVTSGVNVVSGVPVAELLPNLEYEISCGAEC